LFQEYQPHYYNFKGGPWLDLQPLGLLELADIICSNNFEFSSRGASPNSYRWIISCWILIRPARVGRSYWIWHFKLSFCGQPEFHLWLNTGQISHARMINAKMLGIVAAVFGKVVFPNRHSVICLNMQPNQLVGYIVQLSSTLG